jgi:hypothetical protein
VKEIQWLEGVPKSRFSLSLWEKVGVRAMFLSGFALTLALSQRERERVRHLLKQLLE